MDRRRFYSNLKDLIYSVIFTIPDAGADVHVCAPDAGADAHTSGGGGKIVKP